MAQFSLYYPVSASQTTYIDKRFGGLVPVSRPEAVEALAKGGIPSAKAEAVTRYLAEAGVTRRLTQGRRGLNRVGYDCDDIVMIVIGFAAYMPVAAPLAVDELADSVPEPTGALWRSAARDSFEGLLAPLSDEMTLRSWLSATFKRLGGLTLTERKSWHSDPTASSASLQFITPPDIASAVGKSRAIFEWGEASARRRQVFLNAVPASFEEILEAGDPNYKAEFVVNLLFPLLMIAAGLVSKAEDDVTPPSGNVPTTTTSETKPPRSRQGSRRFSVTKSATTDQEESTQTRSIRRREKSQSLPCRGVVTPLQSIGSS